MACPFLCRKRRFDADWPFPQTASLGRGMGGNVYMLRDMKERSPNDEDLKSGCNLGYAKTCSRLPADRAADAVRFALGEERDGILHVLFVCELAYLPAGNGELLYEKRE